MKKMSFICALLASAGFLMTATVVAAADQPAASGDVSKLNAAISQINEQARNPQGESVIARQLEREFNVSSRKIKALHKENTQYGDVAAALAFAEKMRGGITNPNLNEVTRGKNKATWDQVATVLQDRCRERSRQIERRPQKYPDRPCRIIPKAVLREESAGPGHRTAVQGRLRAWTASRTRSRET